MGYRKVKENERVNFRERVVDELYVFAVFDNC